MNPPGPDGWYSLDEKKNNAKPMQSYASMCSPDYPDHGTVPSVGGRQDEQNAGTTPSAAQSREEGQYPSPETRKPCLAPQQSILIIQTSTGTQRRRSARRNKTKTTKHQL